MSVQKVAKSEKEWENKGDGHGWATSGKQF